MFVKRAWVLFCISMLISVVYFAIVEQLPGRVRPAFQALPLYCFIPAAVSFSLYLLAWRHEAMSSPAKYLRAGLYGLTAPVVALILLAVVLVGLLGMNPNRLCRLTTRC